jgi:hypothetical protein
MIRELVACEHEYINTDHPDFIGGTRAVKVRHTVFQLCSHNRRVSELCYKFLYYNHWDLHVFLCKI